MNITISELTFSELEYLLDSDYIFLSNKNTPIIFEDNVIVHSTGDNFRTYISSNYITIPSLNIRVHMAYRNVFDSDYNEYLIDCSGFYMKNSCYEYFELETYLSSAINNFISRYSDLKYVNIDDLKYDLFLNYII